MQTPAALPVIPVPRKSRRRWYLFGGFALLLLGMPLGYWGISSWIEDRALQEIYRALDEEDPHWRWHDLCAHLKPPPDEQNAAVQAMKVYDLLQKTPFSPGPRWESATTNSHRYRNTRLTVEQEKLLRGAFEKLAPNVLAEARKLKDLPEGRLPIEQVENPLEMILPHVQKMRDVMNLLSHDVLLRADRQEMEEAAASCQALLNTVHAINDHPTLISQLVRIAGQALSIAAIETLLGQGEVTPEQLKQLQIFLEREATDPLLYHGLRSERAVTQQIYTLLRERKISYSKLMGTVRVNMGVDDYVLNAFPGLLLRDYPEHLRLMNEQVRASKLPDLERTAAFQKGEQKILKSSSMISRLLMPAFIKVHEADQRSRAYLRCAIIALAAERYRQDHQHWPLSADDLVKAGLLKEALRDPYDGQPLRWRRSGSGLIIYSVGKDRIDDGGKLDRGNPLAPGTDYGFELWEPRLRHAPAVLQREKD